MTLFGIYKDWHYQSTIQLHLIYKTCESSILIWDESSPFFSFILSKAIIWLLRWLKVPLRNILNHFIVVICVTSSWFPLRNIFCLLLITNLCFLDRFSAIPAFNCLSSLLVSSINNIICKQHAPPNLVICTFTNRVSKSILKDQTQDILLKIVLWCKPVVLR